MLIIGCLGLLPNKPLFDFNDLSFGSIEKNCISLSHAAIKVELSIPNHINNKYYKKKLTKL